MEPNPRTATTDPASSSPPNGTPGIELQRTLRGQFRPGHSGNPAGRPRSESAALRQKLTERAVEVVQAVLDAALSGDMTAAKMILDRVVPPLRPHSESVHIPLVASANPADVARSILGAAVAGNITPDTAVQLLSAAAGLSRIIETEELKARLEALERCVAPPKLNQKKRP